MVTIALLSLALVLQKNRKKLRKIKNISIKIELIYKLIQQFGWSLGLGLKHLSLYSWPWSYLGKLSAENKPRQHHQ